MRRERHGQAMVPIEETKPGARFPTMTGGMVRRLNRAHATVLEPRTWAPKPVATASLARQRAPKPVATGFGAR